VDINSTAFPFVLVEKNWSNDVTWHVLLFLAGDSTIKWKIWYRPIPKKHIFVNTRKLP